MSTTVQEIKRRCPSALWARGEKLANARAVTIAERGEEEIEGTVLDGRNLYEVVVYPQDGVEWDCNCGSAFDACEHIAAIALSLELTLAVTSETGESGGARQDVGHVGYRFEEHRGALAVRRVIAHKGADIPIGSGGLRSALPGVRGVPDYALESADRKFEKRLGGFSGGVIPEGLVSAVFGLLGGIKDLTLRGVPMSIGAPTCGLKVRITDHKGEVVARIEQEDDVREAFGNRVIRRGQTLHPLRDHGLSGPRFDELRRGRLFSQRELPTLVSDIIPECRRAEIPISIETDQLPAMSEGVIRPALRLAGSSTSEGVRIDAYIEYGDPPVARVSRERMTLLGEEAVPQRAPRAEKSLLELLRRDYGLSEGENVRGASEAIRIFERAAKNPDVRVGAPEGESFLRVASLVPSLNVSEAGDVHLSFHSSSGEKFNATASEVVAAWERGEGYAPVLEGGFGEIPSDWMAEYGHLVADLLEARAVDGSGPANRALAPQVARLCKALDHPPPPNFAGLSELLAGGTPPAFSYPEDLDATLRSYQLAGVDWLAFHRDAKLGALLADDMGLGKTLQALCVVHGKTLVVAPTSVIRNWEDEARRFRPGLTVCRYHGSARKLDPDANLVLTSYALLRNDLSVLSSIHWDLVVLDEAQFIKNPSSKVAQAAFELEAASRIALTGTPVENRVEELWSQFHFLNRGLLGGRASFKKRYERTIAGGDQAAVDRLREKIRPFVMRRLKKDVAKELPPRTDVVLRCELGKEERRAYDAIRASTHEEVVKMLGQGGGVMKALEALLRLRQAACHRGLLPGASAEVSGMSSKVSLLMETLDQVVAEGHRSLIFSQWTSLLDLVEGPLNERGLRFCRLDGSTRNRGAVVDEFQASDGPDVMLLSLKAGGTGLNLTAADHVFLLDPWWNPAVEDQAADRAHRIGQDRPVLVHRLIAAETVEERILGLQERKRAVAEAALGEAAAIGSGITRDEIMELLR